MSKEWVSRTREARASARAPILLSRNDLWLANTEKLGYNTFRKTEEANTMMNAQPSTIMGDYYNDISTFCKENREAMFITKDGQNDLAVLSMERYEELSRQELYRLLDEGRAAVKEGRVRPREDVMRDIRQRIKDATV